MARKLLCFISAIVLSNISNGMMLFCDPSENGICYTVNGDEASSNPETEILPPETQFDSMTDGKQYFEKRFSKSSPLFDSMRLGKKAALVDSLRLGKRAPLSDALRLRKKASLVDSMRLGKRVDSGVNEKLATLGEGLKLGRGAALIDSMRLGKRSPLSNSMRLGKRPALYDSLRLGKRSPLSDSMRLGKREETADNYDEIDKRAALFDSMRLGKRGWARWQEFDKRKLLSDSLRLGKRSAAFRDSLRLGKRNSDDVNMLDICENFLDNTAIKRASLDEIMRLGKRLDLLEDDMLEQTGNQSEITQACMKLLKFQENILEAKESGTEKRVPLDATLRLG